MPVLHLLAGPNGAGKTTFFEHVLGPATRLPFVNADLIARDRWPRDDERHGHDASAIGHEMSSGVRRRQAPRRRALTSDSAMAEAARLEAIGAPGALLSETVFSGPSKLELIAQAQAAGHLVSLHVRCRSQIT